MKLRHVLFAGVVAIGASSAALYTFNTNEGAVKPSAHQSLQTDLTKNTPNKKDVLTEVASEIPETNNPLSISKGDSNASLFLEPVDSEIPEEFENFLSQLSQDLMETDQEAKVITAFYSAENAPPSLSELSDYSNTLTAASIADWYNDVSGKKCLQATESSFTLDGSESCKTLVSGLLRVNAENTLAGEVIIGDITPDSIMYTLDGISFEMNTENECGTHRYTLSYDQLNNETILPFFIANTGNMPLSLNSGTCSDDGTYITNRSYL